MRDYSTRPFKCGWCPKLLRGYAPKGGDGSAYLMPKHKNSSGQQCKGSYDLKDIWQQDNELHPQQEQDEGK